MVLVNAQLRQPFLTTGDLDLRARCASAMGFDQVNLGGGGLSSSQFQG